MRIISIEATVDQNNVEDDDYEVLNVDVQPNELVSLKCMLN